MNCPKCGAWSSVSETRAAPNLMTKRTRECANGHRFVTFEIHAAVMCSAKQRAAVFARTVADRVRLWKRDAAVRADRKSGMSFADVVKKWGVSRSTLANIIRRR